MTFVWTKNCSLIFDSCKRMYSRSCPAIWITVKCCCPLNMSVKCTLDNSKYTEYNIWHSKHWSVLLYQKLELSISQEWLVVLKKIPTLRILKPNSKNNLICISISFCQSQILKTVSLCWPCTTSCKIWFSLQNPC